MVFFKFMYLISFTLQSYRSLSSLAHEGVGNKLSRRIRGLNTHTPLCSNQIQQLCYYKNVILTSSLIVTILFSDNNLARRTPPILGFLKQILSTCWHAAFTFYTHTFLRRTWETRQTEIRVHLCAFGINWINWK